MEIHLAREGTSLGIFTADDVRAGLSDGRFRRDDLAWSAGMPTWKPLRDWPEFMSAAMNETPAEATTASASQIPWEIRPSPRTLLQSVWMAFTRPAPLVTGRFATGSAFGGAYLALVFALIPLIALTVFNTTQERAQMEALAGLLEGINPDVAQGFRDAVLAQSENDVASPMVLAGCSVFCVAILWPLFGALFACFIWPGLRLLGARPALGRTVTVFILLFGWYLLAVLPVNLGVSLVGLVDPLVGLLAGIIGGLLMLVLFCRAVAAALSCSLWQVIVAHLLFFLFCCGCGFCLVALAAMAGAAAA